MHNLRELAAVFEQYRLRGTFEVGVGGVLSLPWPVKPVSRTSGLVPGCLRAGVSEMRAEAEERLSTAASERASRGRLDSVVLLVAAVAGRGGVGELTDLDLLTMIVTDTFRRA